MQVVCQYFMTKCHTFMELYILNPKCKEKGKKWVQIENIYLLLLYAQYTAVLSLKAIQNQIIEQEQSIPNLAYVLYRHENAISKPDRT